MTNPKILIIEDSPSILILLRDTLEREKYFIRTAVNLKKANDELSISIPDLIVLDRRLPDGDGIDFCRELRSSKKTNNIPILFLTAVNGISDKITGLKVGGDDYLTKPFNTEELTARIAAILRRSTATKEAAPTILKTKGIVLDTNRHECKVNGKIIDLWPKEFELLKLFLSNKNRILSKDILAESVWNYEYTPTSRTIEITVQRLRKKLHKIGNIIETIKTYGYILREK